MMFPFLLAVQLAAAPAPVTFETARSTPVTPGRWTYLSSATGSESRFGINFSIRCDRASRTVTLRRIEPIATTPLTPLTISTDAATRTLPAAGAALMRTDTLLDAIAFSRGRFIVSGGGGVPLVLPAWPEAARAIEDCRN